MLIRQILFNYPPLWLLYKIDLYFIRFTLYSVSSNLQGRTRITMKILRISALRTFAVETAGSVRMRLEKQKIFL